MEGVQKIALFIDADNVSARFGKLLMDNLEKRGEILIRRIYGNWEKPALRKWDDCILHYGSMMLTPFVQFIFYSFIGGISAIFNIAVFLLLCTTALNLNINVWIAFILSALLNYLLCIAFFSHHPHTILPLTNPSM